MKKILLLLAAGFVGTTAMAQSLVVTSDSLVLTGPSNVLMTARAVVTNTSANPIFVLAKRDTASMVLAPGHVTYFCWAGTCYPPNVNVSPNYSILFPGESDTTFYADVSPQGNPGSSTVTYRFYDMDNESDFTDITFTYNALTAGINELNKPGAITSVFPNPADAFTRINCTTTSSKQSRLVITNLLGSIVKEFPVTANQTSVLVPTSGLNSGIYICSIMVGNKTAGSEKLVVTHR